MPVHPQANEPLLHYVLKLNSRSHHNNIADIDVEYSNPLLLDPEARYECSLLKATIPKGWNNISVALTNNLIEIGGTFVTLPDGHYNLDTVEMYIKDWITDNHSLALSNEFKIEPLYYNAGCKITAPSTLSVKVLGICSVLGFVLNTTIAAGNRTYGTSPVDFSGGVSEIEVMCNLVDSKYCRANDRREGLLYTSSPLGGDPYSRVNLVDTTHHYVPISQTDRIHKIEISLKNQNGTLIELNDFPANLSSEFVIGIKKVNKSR